MRYIDVRTGQDEGAASKMARLMGAMLDVVYFLAEEADRNSSSSSDDTCGLAPLKELRGLSQRAAAEYVRFWQVYRIWRQ